MAEKRRKGASLSMVSPKLSKLIVVVGATAVGKTDLAMKLAGDLCAEIISADSMQVYRQMDIGTAKPSPEERERIPHHLLDIVNPDETFNAARFVESAAAVIQTLHSRKTPILIVGGTGLYIRALLGGLFAGPDADDDLRKTYHNQREQYGPDYLHEVLRRIDEKAAQRIDRRDTVRIIRALEVMELTGRSIVDQQKAHGFGENRYEYIKIGLSLDRPVLNERIERRTQAMVEAGLVNEVRQLLDLGYGEDLKPMQSLGYKHIVLYLKGKIGLAEAIDLTIRDTRRYAKRQGTWFRAETDVSWFSPNEFEKIQDIVQRFLNGGDLDFA